MMYVKGSCLVWVIKMLTITTPVVTKDTQHHSECAALFSHCGEIWRRSGISSPRGGAAELLVVSILTHSTLSIESLEEKTQPKRKIHNTSILKEYCENCIKFVGAAQVS